ncbi:MAG TPA: hypothetical protein VHZ73_10020, partial [Vicinamibacterales bacterium]|nr:hypothetical protein [Vicinamibacterales bacterium]
AEYGRSLLDSPHKIVLAPTVNLPFGEGRHWLNHGGVVAAIIGGWSVNAATTLQSGFPMGVSQQVLTTTSVLYGGATRPDLVAGVPIVLSDITQRIQSSPTNNLYLNAAAFTTSAATTFGNEPRILPGVYSPWRNNTDLGINKSVGLPWNTHAQFRIEVLNLFNQVEWAAPASSFGSSSFGQITTQANNARTIQFTVRYQF